MFTDVVNFINQHIGLTPEDLQVIFTNLEECNFKKKQNVIEAGEVENYVHLIKKGLVRVFFQKGETEFITQFVREGGVMCSAASFFSRKPSRYTIEAMEDTVTYRISRKKVENLYKTDNKWEKFGRIITSHFLLVQEKNILDVVQLTVRQRFVKFVTENPELVMRVPQKHLASFLNIKQETFSRMKHLMLDQQVVKF